MRRPWAGIANRHSGGLGSPSGPTTGLCLYWLDAAGMKAKRKLWPDEGSHEAPVPARKHGPGDRKAARGASRGAAHPLGAHTCVTRHYRLPRREFPGISGKSRFYK